MSRQQELKPTRFQQLLDAEEAALAAGRDPEPADHAAARLEAEVSGWADFLRPYLHSRSALRVPVYRHDNDVQPFESHAAGREVARRSELFDELEERIRFFLEECNSPQGMQLFLDMHDGFGGIACGWGRKEAG